MSVALETVNGGNLAIRITGVASTDAGAQGEVANPEGVTLFILRATLIVNVTSTGSANISIGVAATGGTFTDMINALAMGSLSSLPKAYNCHAMQNTTKTEIAAPARWDATDVLGITGSASLVGLDADLLVEYVRCPNEA